jgi:hypothetical protein
MQVLLHLGFHKTGTSSAQGFLHANRTLIWPQAALVLPGRIRPVAHAVFNHGFERTRTSLSEITTAMRGVLAAMTLGPKRRIVISSENLLGPMPLGLTEAPYPEAAAIVRALLDGFAGLGWSVEVTLYLSTRAQEGWAESLWAHQARKTQPVPFAEDLASFRARLGRVPLAAQLDSLRAGLPEGRFLVHDCADFAAMRFGAGQPFVDFLALPKPLQDQFRPVPRKNVSPPRPVTEELIALNRSALGADALAEAKRALLARAGWEQTDPREEKA